MNCSPYLPHLGYINVKRDKPKNIRVKRILEELNLIDPWLGSRRLVTVLERDYAVKVKRKRVQRLRREMGIEAIYCKPRTSIVNKEHRKFPYLLRNLEVDRVDKVWEIDIIYVPIPYGNAYLCAVMKRNSRKVLGWAQHNGYLALYAGI